MIGTYRGILTDKNVSPNVKRIVLKKEPELNYQTNKNKH